MKELESLARLAQGALRDAQHHPLWCSARVLEASRAYHTNIRMVSLQEMTLSGLINQVGDVRAQGPSDALVMAVRAMRIAAAKASPPPLNPPPDNSPAHAPTLPRSQQHSFRNVLYRQLHGLRTTRTTGGDPYAL